MSTIIYYNKDRSQCLEFKNYDHVFKPHLSHSTRCCPEKNAKVGIVFFYVNG